MEGLQMPSLNGVRFSTIYVANVSMHVYITTVPKMSILTPAAPSKVVIRRLSKLKGFCDTFCITARFGFIAAYLCSDNLLF